MTLEEKLAILIKGNGIKSYGVRDEFEIDKTDIGIIRTNFPDFFTKESVHYCVLIDSTIIDIVDGTPIYKTIKQALLEFEQKEDDTFDKKTKEKIDKYLDKLLKKGQNNNY